MASRQPNHRHDCPCNDCVRRRNARRRREANRYAEEGRPLPQRSQLYEIERGLPPVYEPGSMEVHDIVDAVRNRTSRQIPPANPDDFLNQRASPVQPAVDIDAAPRPSQSGGGMKGWLIILVIAAAIGGVAYCAVQSKLIEFNAPTVSLPAILPTETPTPTQPPPTETPIPDATVMMPPTPTSAPTDTPIPIPTATPVPTPTAEIATSAPTEREIVVNAFAECDGQYSGADHQFRAQAANHAIDEGRQTVADIRELVDEYCGGAIPKLAVGNTEHPTTTKPTATATPTSVPTVRPTPTKVPTPRPTPTAATGDTRFNRAEMEVSIHEGINAYRQLQGRTKLEWDSRLAKIALVHSEDMAQSDRYSHINRAGDDPSARARKAGYSCNNPLSIGVAENIHLLYGHTTMLYGRPYQWETQARMVERFVADWISSPGHRRNILDPRYGKTGIGVAFGTAAGIEGGIYVTQKFC